MFFAMKSPKTVFFLLPTYSTLYCRWISLHLDLLACKYKHMDTNQVVERVEIIVNIGLKRGNFWMLNKEIRFFNV